MPGYFRAALSLALLLGLFCSPVQAQTSGRGPLVLQLPASTQALALGDAYHLATRSADAVFYHPGQLSRASGFGASLQRFSERGTLVGISAGTSWFGGGVAIGVRQLSYETTSPYEPDFSCILSSMYNPDCPGDLYFPEDDANLRDEGGLGVSETVLSVGYGRTVMGLQAGVVGKLIEQRLGSRKAGTAAVDLGVASSQGPITMGLSVQNLGSAMIMAGEDVPLPTRFILGASSDAAPVGPLDISASTAMTYQLDGDLVPSLGLEVGYWPINGRTFVGRVGYRYRSDDFTATPLTFGGAFMGDNITLEYTYQGYETGDPSHRFGIGWR